MKIISNNLVRKANITATSTAAGHSVESVKTNTMTDAHKAAGTGITYVLAFPVPVEIGGAHLLCNLSHTAVMRVRGYDAATGGALVVDTTEIYACPAEPVELIGDWTPQTAANAYAFGGGSHARAWFANTFVRRLEVEITDTANLQGAIEVARIFVGKWREPVETADYGASATAEDSSASYRDDAGNLRHENGFKIRKHAIDLSNMDAADRKWAWSMMLANGKTQPIIFSLYPDDEDAELERDNQGFFCFANIEALKTPGYERYATSLPLESL